MRRDGQGRVNSKFSPEFMEEGRLFGYECKWSAARRVAAPRSWLGAYPEAEFTVITPQNYLDFVL